MTAEITGTIESIRGPYGDGFYILSVSTPEIVNVTGNFIRPEVGDCLRFEGSWDIHKSYGRQFKAQKAGMKMPKGVRGVQLYMQNKFPNVGPAIAERLYDRFGDKLFHVIEHEPEKLTDIRGISKPRATEISDTYKQISSDKANDLFLSTHHISNATVSNMLQRYGNLSTVVAKIKENPYRLIDDVYGIGWKKADAIGNAMNISRTSLFRIRAGIIHVLSEATTVGHCYLPEVELVVSAKKVLSCDENMIKAEIDYLAGEKKIVMEMDEDQPIYYSRPLWKAEFFVAEKLRRLCESDIR